jgi:hypothetical protein
MSEIIRYNDLNYDEKFALTDEQVKDYIKLECAYAGVKILPEPTQPIKPEIGETINAYRIGYNSDLTFEKAEDAAKVLEFLGKFNVVFTNWEANMTFISRVEKFNSRINPESFHTKEDYEKNKEALRLYNRQKESYDKLKEEYDKNYKLVNDIEEDIWDDAIEKRNAKKIQTVLTEKYLEYLDMAKGDTEIALSFLTSAYKEELDKIEEVMGNDTFIKNIKETVKSTKVEFNPLV